MTSQADARRSVLRNATPDRTARLHHPFMEPDPRNDVATRLRGAGIDHAEQLADLAEAAWRITTARTTFAALERGASRFAGTPDVPPDFAWPARDGRALSFLAQIDLTEVSSPDLPPTGWLLVFYDVDAQPGGHRSKDAEGWRVVHVDAPRDSLARRSAPRTRHAPFAPCSLRLRPVADLPDLDDTALTLSGVRIDDAQWDAYMDVSSMLSGGPHLKNDASDENERYHHLLGHPQIIQGDMREDCERLTTGGSRATAPERWRLLLQIDSDEDGPGWTWGDGGRLYFWIRRDDLAARAFDRVWLVLQCT